MYPPLAPRLHVAPTRSGPGLSADERWAGQCLCGCGVVVVVAFLIYYNLGAAA